MSETRGLPGMVLLLEDLQRAAAAVPAADVELVLDAMREALATPGALGQAEAGRFGRRLAELERVFTFGLALSKAWTAFEEAVAEESDAELDEAARRRMKARTQGARN